MPGAHHEQRRATSTPRFKAAAKTVSASFTVPVQRPHADRPGAARSPTTSARRCRQGHGHRVLEHAERRERVTDVRRDARPDARRTRCASSSTRARARSATATTTSTSPSSAALMSQAGRRPGAPAADALGRAGLDALRPGDHARHAGRRRREGQHRRLRGHAVRAGEHHAAPPRGLLGDVPGAPGAGGTNAENLAPMYKVADGRARRAGLPADLQDA